MADIRLWTPVANAFEAYRRRIIADPQSVYEHIWRLIHIHESLVVTLGVALATRLLSIWRVDPKMLSEANRLRRKVTGLSTPGDANTDLDLSNGDACLDGYIKPWIDLLKDFGSVANEIPSGFCASVASYVNHKPDQPVAFIEAWKKVAEVPQVFTGSLSRIDRYDSINTLRNKLAHVPIPHKVLQDLHWGLRQEVLALMTSEYKPQSDSATSDFETTKWFPVLKGRLLSGKNYVTGSAFGQISDPDPPADGTVVMMVQDTAVEKWTASPFIRIDAELKVSLLFLLNDVRTDPTSEEFKGEYHRFAAELLPVQKEKVPQQLVCAWIPVAIATLETSVPTGSATEQPQVEPTPTPFAEPESLNGKPPHELRSIADNAFRSRDFVRAVSVFDALAATGDPVSYNDVARSKHGGSLWRVAEMRDATVQGRADLITRAIQLLDSASQHRDPGYRARAFYEKSKALWHQWKLTANKTSLVDSLRSAEDAATMQNEPSYISWFEKVRDDLEAGVENAGQQVAHPDREQAGKSSHT